MNIYSGLNDYLFSSKYSLLHYFFMRKNAVLKGFVSSRSTFLERKITGEVQKKSFFIKFSKFMSCTGFKQFEHLNHTLGIFIFNHMI